MLLSIFKVALLSITFLFSLYIFFSFKKSPDFPKFLSKLNGMLIEDKHDRLWSSQRFGYLMTLFFANFCMWGVFIVVAVINETIPDIPMSVVTIYCGAIGIPSYFKYKQKEVEIPNKQETEETAQ